jgi:small subunit ribosomal protein S6
MLVLRPDLADDKTQAVVDRTTRAITGSGGQIVKVAPWGRRRLAYPIDRHREGSYHIILFEAPSDSIIELERGLLITEELLRHLVTRVERPVKAARRDGSSDDGSDLGLAPPPPSDEIEDDDDDDRIERIDESESEAAPAAIE